MVSIGQGIAEDGRTGSLHQCFANGALKIMKPSNGYNTWHQLTRGQI